MVRLKKRKKYNLLEFIILLTFIILLIFTNISNASKEENIENEVLEKQKEELNILSFLKEAETYTNENIEDLNISEIFSSALKGKIDNDNILKKVIRMAGKEILSTTRVLGSILIIIIIHSILKSISDGLENESISKITYFVQYILIATLIMKNFSDILNMVRNSINNLVGFMNSLVPLLITLMLTTGNIASAGLLEPIIIFLITFIGNFINSVLVPFVLISTILSIISKVSSKVQVGKLGKFFNSSVVWILGTILTIFVGVVSIEGNLSSTVDGITAKTAKTAVSTFVPVVGKILGDAIDSVIGCNNVLKNAVGVVGVIVVLFICISPIIKLLGLMFMYNLASAICEPIADEKIVKLLEQMGNTFKMLFAIVCSVSAMLIIGITLVIKITNSGLMYR